MTTLPPDSLQKRKKVLEIFSIWDSSKDNSLQLAKKFVNSFRSIHQTNNFVNAATSVIFLRLDSIPQTNFYAHDRCRSAVKRQRDEPQ